jgi:hypothetical protein
MIRLVFLKVVTHSWLRKKNPLPSLGASVILYFGTNMNVDENKEEEE